MPPVRPAAVTERYPRPRLEKLGIQPDSTVTLVDVDDPAFDTELRARTPHVRTARASRLPREQAFLVVRVDARDGLDRLTALRGAIRQDGAIWVLWRKGQAALTEDHVRRAALAQGLVDVKVMAFSAELSALKLVIPRAQRIAGAPTRRMRR
jgi:hypothetical protein